MNATIDETHAPDLTSWVPGANVPGSDFPIQNLPFGAFTPNSGSGARLGVAIGDCVLDLRAASERGLLDDASNDATRACRETTLNGLMALGPRHWHSLRLALSRVLRTGSAGRTEAERHLIALRDVEMNMPVEVGDYTDFYTSIHHATNAGRLFRPENPLLPNFEHLPVGYHGRASSVVVSGTPCRRPWGQLRAGADAAPGFAPTGKLDFELELGVFVGTGNRLGEPISIDEAEQHLFGLCLLNDWSARDIQAWEYQPLGPFLGKSFMTSISPWVVTLEALAPFRVPAERRREGAPSPLPYLQEAALAERSALDIEVGVELETERMRRAHASSIVLAQARFSQQYWSVFQMLAHHASNGCNLRPGDLLGTGTISGTGRGEEGCLLEMTHNGARPVELPTGELRRFLEDGDEVVMRARCRRDGFVPIGFGECRGRVEPAVPYWREAVAHV